MSTQTPTLAQLVPDFAGDHAVWSCAVEGLTTDEASGVMTLHVAAERLIDEDERRTAERAIGTAYGATVRLAVAYRFLSLNDAAIELIRASLSAKYPSAAFAFSPDAMTVKNGKLHIVAPQDWVFRLETLKGEMEAYIAAESGLAVALEIAAREDEDAEAEYERRRNAEIRRMQEEFQREQANAPRVQKAPEASPENRFFDRKKQVFDETFRPDEQDEVLYGKPVARGITRLCDITNESGKVAVQGEIFFTSEKQLGNRGKTICVFEFSDGTGSLRAVKIVAEEDVPQWTKLMKKETPVIVQGEISYSRFDQDIVITPSAIIKGKKKVRRDTAAQKRVELHLHTSMSAMDGLCDTEKALKLAASMGHRALAITDHGVAQAYPAAMNAISAINKSGNDMKVIYGIEAYCRDDTVASGPVKGFCDIALTDEIIVFDLETTGLKAADCEIIEIAAALVCGGAIKERFHTFVRPRKAIPAEITNLTSITNEMVAAAPRIDEVLPRFLEFCGNRPLCAHNADFDISFLRAACDRLEIPRKFCSIDTVELARVLLPQLKKHRLNIVAEHFGFTFQHHRADDDTDVLAKIFFELCKLLGQHGVTRLPDVNDLIEELRAGGAGKQKRERTYHLIILVKNAEGLQTLYRLISDSNLKYFKKVPIIPLSLLLENREDLILGSACEAGELFSAVVEGKPWSDLLRLAKLFDYLEIQPVGNNRFMVQKGIARDDEQLRDYNRTILKLGDALGIPVCATGDVHFMEPEDAIFREILMTGKGFDDADNQPPLYFKTTDEMLREFSYLGSERAFEVVVTNPNKIADMCDVIRPIPEGTYPPSIEHSAEEIEQMARSKAKELYGDPLPELVAERLEKELRSIISNGFDVMYIIAQKLVAKSLDAGYLVGSRGSVGSSFVAFLTGITEVNALEPHYLCPQCKYSQFHTGTDYFTGVDLPDADCPQCGTRLLKDGFNILFATFLGFDGDKAPDIDLNFSGEYQLRAHKDTIELFGEGNVFKAGTIAAVKDRTAYGYVHKYLEEKGKIVSRAEENRLVQGCMGTKSTTGQHPGGLIVVPNGMSIHQFCPVQHPADKADSDIITTHFDYHSIHDNLLKLDLLGHDDPTMIRKLHDLSGFDPRLVPLDDPQTMKIFSSIAPLGIEGDDILGYATGAAAIPEFGTKFVRGMLEDTKPTTFDELLKISGLSHGTNVWLNNAKDLIVAGTATLKDVIGVRDDITIKLMHMGLEPKKAFTIAESVRKGKGLKPDWIEEMKAHGVPDWYIESCIKIKYLFPRAHAAAYVMMAYRIAWFKVHRPLDFYSAYFSIRANAFDAAIMTRGDAVVCDKYHSLKKQEKLTAVEEDMLITLEVCHEFYKRGFAFSSVDLYRSEVSGFRIDGNTLIPPFTSLPGLGETAAASIVRERENGPFMSAEDIVIRCDKVSTAVIESLRKAGALDMLPETNQLDLFSAFNL